jgi:Family of unknown function (DUF5681)
MKWPQRRLAPQMPRDGKKLMTSNKEQPEAPSLDSYEVGYGKPPKHSQFQKGKSGNPKGRPKGSKSASTLIAEMYSKPVTVIVNGKPTKMPMIVALVGKMLATGMSGDLKALKLALEMYAKYGDIANPSTIGGLIAGQTPFELTAEEYDSIAKHKLLDGVH